MDDDYITISYRGEPYKVPNNMRALRQVERVMMRPEVQEDLQTSQVMCPVDIAEIFRNLLVLAGCDVAVEEVRFEIFGSDSSAKEALAATNVIMSILEQRTPPPALQDQAKKKPARTKAPSGKKPTKS